MAMERGPSQKYKGKGGGGGSGEIFLKYLA